MNESTVGGLEGLRQETMRRAADAESSKEGAFQQPPGKGEMQGSTIGSRAMTEKGVSQSKDSNSPRTASKQVVS